MTKPEDLLSEALGLYALEQPKAEFIRHNENMTYKVTDAEGKYVLRIHKRAEGFSADIHGMALTPMELIQGELDIITALKKGTDIPMQTPVYGRRGSLVQSLADGTPVTLLAWVEGQTVDTAGMTPELLRNSGKMMAKMHLFFSRRKEIEKPYSRYSYDQGVLPRIADKIESAARAEAITQEQARTILKALEETRKRFNELDTMEEKQIVHGDLGKSNVILGAEGLLTPIDFSLCGYSHTYMDIGGMYGLSHDDKNRKYILEGYKSIKKCEVNPRYVEPYFALGVVLFIACQYERAKDWDWFPDNMKRWCRDIFEPLGDRKAFLLA